VFRLPVIVQVPPSACDGVRTFNLLLLICRWPSAPGIIWITTHGRTRKNALQRRRVILPADFVYSFESAFFDFKNSLKFRNCLAKYLIVSNAFHDNLHFFCVQKNLIERDTRSFWAGFSSNFPRRLDIANKQAGGRFVDLRDSGCYVASPALP